MPRVDLQVPFSEKDDARRFGARWDPHQKIWYVPANVDPAPLHKWIPRTPQPNVRASLYFVATTTRDCWRCATPSRVAAFVLPAGHEAYYVGDDPADDCWQSSEMPIVLSYVEYLTERVAARLLSVTPHYRIDFSQTTQKFYWMNHCEHCTAKLGDFDTVCEYGVGFGPATSEQASAINLEKIVEPFSTTCGGYTYIEWFAEARHLDSSVSQSAPRRQTPSFIVRTVVNTRHEKN